MRSKSHLNEEKKTTKICKQKIKDTIKRIGQKMISLDSNLPDAMDEMCPRAKILSAVKSRGYHVRPHSSAGQFCWKRFLPVVQKAFVGI